MTLIALVRHGQTDWNLAGRIQGTSDIPLNATGRAQARDAGLVLSDETWDGLYASRLARARETAALIGEHLGLAEVVVLDGVQERRYGQAEGLTGAEIRERWPDGLAAPGEESRADVVVRASAALHSLAESAPDARLVVVSHGGVISSLLRHVSGGAFPPPGQFVQNGSAHLFEVDSAGIRLVRYAGEDVPELPASARV